MENIDKAALRPSPKAILYGALVVGILDLADAVIFWWLYANVSPPRIFKSIAAGIYGREIAQAGGPGMDALGIFLHFVIAALIATVFYLASLKLRFLLRRPVACGLLYGLVCYFVMQYVVVPLSNAPGPSLSWGPFLNGIIGHALLVGLPVALIARRTAKQ